MVRSYETNRVALFAEHAKLVSVTCQACSLNVPAYDKNVLMFPQNMKAYFKKMRTYKKKIKMFFQKMKTCLENIKVFFSYNNMSNLCPATLVTYRPQQY